ncbi:hypothetical protein KCTC52924_03601 [Arenibacter antarcticus]|uniref:Uncharacterized protein n=1 Tax=Arenibacter antarcticus TaxID=2040469 RepID=A0ABW5VE33_9FLAO|nr:hypothetical protein [Arenibacter sp. H213]MCM4169821.1 hypothetical protein [Arenibacter sp. H213]
MRNNIQVKRAFLDLLYIKTQVKKLLGHEEKYKALIAFMMSENFVESDEPIPSLKSMELILNLKTYTLRKLIIDLYNELFGNELKYGLGFPKLEVQFDLRYFEEQWGYFKCDKLAFIPRLGENITIPFLKARVGTDWFYVDSIRHILEGSTQRIEIGLKGGYL